MFNSNSCSSCQRYNTEEIICDAFPEGIPDAIIYGENLHDKPVSGDHGLQYLPVADALTQIGTPESGHWGHGGRPGEVGGSSPGGTPDVIPVNRSAIFDMKYGEHTRVAERVDSEVKRSGIVDYMEHRYRVGTEESKAQNRAGLHYFGTPASFIVNGYLRGNLELSKSYKEESQITVDSLDLLLEKSSHPLPVGLELYRGLGVKSGEAVANLNVGDVCVDKGFQSFTYDPVLWESFAQKWSGDKTEAPHHKTIIRALTTGGEKVIYNSMEREFLFPRGTSWKVVAKEDIDAPAAIYHFVTVIKND